MVFHYKMNAHVVFADHQDDEAGSSCPSQCWCWFTSRLAEKVQVYIMVCVVCIHLKLSPIGTHNE